MASQVPAVCSVHTSTNIAYYCYTCGRFACRRCNECFDEGNAHILDKISVYIKKKIIEIGEAIKESEKKENIMQEQLSKGEQLESVMEDVAKDRKKRVGQLKTKIDELISREENELKKSQEADKEIIKNYVVSCSKARDKVTETIKHLKELKESLENVKGSSAIDIVKGHMQLTQINLNIELPSAHIIKGLETLVEQAKRPMVTTLEKFENYAAGLEKEKEKFAEVLIHPVPMTNYAIVYDTKKKEATKVYFDEECKVPFYCGTAVDEKVLYIAGGTLNLDTPLKTTLRINIENPTICMPDEKLQTARYQNLLCKIGNTLVTFCGRGSVNGMPQLLDDIETLCLNPLGSWTPATKFPMKACCMSGTAGTIDGKPCIYIFGGITETPQAGTMVTNKIFTFSLIGNEVKEIVTLGMPTLHSAGITSFPLKDGKSGLFIFGGSKGTSSPKDISQSVYQIADKRVTAASGKLGLLAQPDTFDGACPVVAGEKIYIMGHGMIHYKDGDKWEVSLEKEWCVL